MKSSKPLICISIIICWVTCATAALDIEFEKHIHQYISEDGSNAKISKITLNTSKNEAIAVINTPSEVASGWNYGYLLKCSLASGEVKFTKFCTEEKLWSKDYSEHRLWIADVAPSFSPFDKSVMVSAGILHKSGGSVIYKWMLVNLLTSQLIEFASLEFYKNATFVIYSGKTEVIIWYPDKNTAIVTSENFQPLPALKERSVRFKISSASIISEPPVSPLELEFLKWIASGKKNEGENKD